MNTKRLVMLAGLGLVVLWIVGCGTGAIVGAMRGTEGFLPQPGVHLPPQAIMGENRGETVSGGFVLTNTMLSSFITTGVLILLFWFGASRMKVVPGRLQSLLEAIVEGLLGVLEAILGQVRTRQLFPLLATIFLFVMFNAWLGLLPVYQVLGITRYEAVTLSELDKHALEFPVSQENAKLPLADVKELEHLVAERLVVTLEAKFVAEGMTPEAANEKAHEKAMKKAHQAKVSIVNDGHAMTHAVLVEGHRFGEGAEAAVVAAGGKIRKKGAGLSATLLRPAGTDMNMPLALALISFVFVEGLGLMTFRLRYLNQFFPFGRLIRGDVIGFVVGLLEVVSHFVRVISFTFRLWGNMTAGEILLFLISFLASFVAVDLFYGLELLVGAIQALVFMGLTAVFAAMAMAPHEGEPHEGRQAQEPHH